MNLDGALNTFFAESKENLEKMEKDLLFLNDNPADSDTLNDLFRQIHTIKGSAGMFDLKPIMNVTHKFENILDKLRKGEMEISTTLIDFSLDVHDHLTYLTTILENDPYSPVDEETLAIGETFAQKMREILQENPITQTTEKTKIEKKENETKDCNSPEVKNGCWHISLRFEKNIFINGLDPYAFISYLNQKGKIKSIVTFLNTTPALNDFNPQDCYLGFEIDFLTEDPAIDKAQIMDTFEFIKDDSIINILPPHSKIDDYCKFIEDLPHSDEALGKILLDAGTLTKEELNNALKLQEKTNEDENENINKKKIGEILVEEKILAKPVLNAALEKQATSKHIIEKEKRSMRVDADKIDQLITLVGELVISSANISQKALKTQNSELLESVHSMTRLVNEVRDSSMSMRMVPIGETFNTFRRTVHDLCKQTGKEINLVINGGETELDKTLIEKIQDPLMHLIRNAADHGIGSKEERIAAGKKAQGTITLNAYHESGNIVIEVCDDGAGLNREKIFAKAVEKNLLKAENSNITNNALWQMILEPGFSTAEKITNISGRGVGMDVVKKNIESMRGVLDIESTPGEGTSFKIHLPLTLAIIDGFLIKVGNNSYVIPLDLINESTDVKQEKLGTDGGNFFNLRGEILPFLRLKDLFKLPANQENENIVIVEYAHKKAGLVVDELLGEFQTVIKPLGNLFKNLKWISGATILANGDVALILDIPQLIKYVQEQNNQEQIRRNA